MERFFGYRKIMLYASGTAALAQAMAQCALRTATRNPEVIIPAYGCPDLVAACMHASVFPRLVDLAPSCWSYDLEALKTSLSPNTTAIVAVNLLGLGDGAAELRHLSKDRNIPLIQDSAQYLPREQSDWIGDHIVLSFGRGKPLNLLHGGALVLPSGEAPPTSVQPALYTMRERLLSSAAAAAGFNTLTRPALYRIFSSLPGTGLGDVTYKPLGNPAPLPERAWGRVATAFELYLQKPSYRRDIWTAALEEWSSLGIVVLHSPGSSLQAEPLRLPLLAPNRAARDTLVDNLTRAGLGASRFYGCDLTAVAGIPEIVKCQGPFPNASELADRLFTLPTHELVDADTVSTARGLVLAWCRANEGVRIRAP
ncbi:MAG: DegT/DnrJ/EryC1/StrS family aminotransferase [Steroidobacteraceae bacterium]